MVDFDRARQVMLDSQIRAGGVTNERIIAAMRAVPRELFVPDARRDLAYVDDLHWFGQPRTSRFMPSPASLARLLQLLEIHENDAVLDIGASTGYATALVASLAASVTGLEQDAALAATAQHNLARLGIANASIVAGDIAAIGPNQFDAIFAQGMLNSVPPGAIAALRDGGRLVTLIRNGAIGVAHVFVKTGGAVTTRQEFNGVLPTLLATPQEAEFIF
ncbi:protein-L-isoaspartate(D-aspartate) O-methyltransferase [Devosia sp. YR412]|uniref:protein-L-isoaspartate O-methyltransferase family protein n=1 Tax=Devosia sp. YR412 TaxID=1881030 RepID=UPI0008AEBD73|nr:protein-L-isoaspartate O-methyltransferase [Devosia sp. YR412]SEQ58441.1 protein-L-isoaspartate(D-aspartate) O-methyltransferase [Devosia sp. YR412]